MQLSLLTYPKQYDVKRYDFFKHELYRFAPNQKKTTDRNDEIMTIIFNFPKRFVKTRVIDFSQSGQIGHI